MKFHLRKWGVVYLLLFLFLGSWLGQFFVQLASPATLENWQWLQLFVQAAVLLGMKHLIFLADAEDMERRREAKLDRLMETRESIPRAAAEHEQRMRAGIVDRG